MMLSFMKIVFLFILSSFQLNPITSFVSPHHINRINHINRRIYNHHSSTSTTTATRIIMSSSREQQPPSSPSRQDDDFTTSWEPKMAQLIYSQQQQQYKTQQFKDKKPFIIALVGIPGSGKSTSSQILSNHLQQIITKGSTTTTTFNTAQEQEQEVASSVMVMPMDGYHLPLSTLESKPNSKELIYKRGSPDTFDPQSLLNDLKRIRGISKQKDGNENGLEDDNDDNNNDDNNNDDNNNDDNSNIVHIPGFDHAVGDPQPNAYTFHRNQHSFVICEGLYLLHQDKNNENDEDENQKDNDNGWSQEIEKQFDLTIFINANVDTCIERLKVRNKCIPGYTHEEIDIRCDLVDRANAMLVLKSKDRAMHVVDSVVAS
jgi:pantothenate kinase